MAASFEASDGAKPPSSPWPVAWPSSWRIARSAAKISEPARSASREGRDADRHDHELLEVGRVLGVLAAVEDVEHRDRQGPRADAAEVAVERQVVRGRGGVRVASDTPRIAFAPSSPLFGVPSSSISRRSMPAWSAASEPASAGAMRSMTLATALRTPLPP